MLQISIYDIDNQWKVERMG